MADIALQTMLPKINTPFEAQGQALQLRQLMQAGQEQEYQQQQRQQAQADDASYRQALQSSGGDSTRMLSALAGSGNYKGYAAQQKADLDLRKGNTDIEKDKATTQETKIKALNKAFTLHRDQINLVNDPQTAAQWVASAYQDPVLGPLVAQSGPIEDAIKRIPTDPQGFAKWKLQAGTSADEYVKRTTVDANTAATVGASIENSKRTNDRIEKEGRLNRSNQLEVQDRMTARQSDRLSAPGVEASLSPSTIKRLAEMEINGDKSGRAGLGRGAQGAANLTAVQNAITDLGAERGVSARDITAASANLEGLRTGMRATGNISARVENAVEEAAQLAPLALTASRNVVRAGLLPFGKLQDMFDVNSNNTALADFATKNEGLVTAYASAMARGGKATVDDKIHARKLLTTAKDQPAYESTVNAMLGEMDAAKRAPRNVRDSLKEEINGKHSAGSGGGKVIDFGSLP